MFNNVLTGSVLGATLLATTPVIAYDAGGHHAFAVQHAVAAHYGLPGHGMMQGTPHGNKPRLGVALGEMSQQALGAMQLEYGVKVTGVMPGSAASRAGIRPGDVVTDVDGRPAYSPERMQFLVNEASASPTVTLRREGQQIRLEVSLDNEKPAGGSERAMLGVRIQAMTDDLKQAFGAQGGHGVLISQVKPGSAAGEAGMKAGDVIVRIGGTDIGGVNDVFRIVGDSAPGEAIELTILRDRQQQTIRLALGSAPDALQAQAMHPHGMHGYGHAYGHGYGMKPGYGFHGDGKKGACHAGKMLRPS